MNLGRTTSKVTIASATYGVALKAAMRLAGAFLNGATTRQTVIILKLPPQADERAYEAAAGRLVKSNPNLLGFLVIRADVTRRGLLDVKTLDDALVLGRPLVILWPLGIKVPIHIVAAADRIVDVRSVRPFHLVSAAKEVEGRLLDIGEATRLLEYPLASVFASMRAGRSTELVLKRLQAAHLSSDIPTAGPGLDELEGYGEAREWGLALAEDIRAWQSADIPWSEVDRGILISGPPGSGKTLFASALARSCGVEVVATSVSRWQSAGHLGDMLGAMRKSFQEATAKKPCILFLDELDSVGDRATFKGDNAQYSSQVVNGLLELVDGYDRLEGVVLVGATNFPEKIDPALLRAGRLDRHIAIPLPDAETRRSLCRRYIRNDMPEGEIETIVRATSGLSGADFERIGRDIRRRARRERSEITASLALQVLPPALKIEGERRRTVAVHEAGHAIVGIRVAVGRLDSIVIARDVPRTGSAAGFAHFVLDGDVERNRQTFLSQIAMLLGGRLAEEVILGSAFEGSGGEGSDIHKATDLATVMEVQLGMGESLGYFRASSSADLEELRRRIPAVRERVEKVLLKQWKRARTIVEEHVGVIELVASQLAAKGRLDGKDVEQMMSAKLRERSS
ncbi:MULTISPECIES: AAA family ATPase [Rhizobium]|uniref:ATP-dependent hydrolase protein n=1 Tax=Rhizobium johnstonii (strain DSM 114642 / LMG 32736 / 3841) TaxID=216596 RepID=Q1MHY7_RHIJ3|nr:MULTISPECIES: AAA family ATPase [Rhizobium]MBB5261215.1 SpoVK/Ycf46/Vps4 family AAA+-type ATPase [Rhizobium leguminosarum]MBY5378057.1 AAA family ATPase [Rhizobium leguminosarum]MDX6000405.1 AAA family ATPase [Rhizobium leguminosarum]NEJ81707.1 AAA family ATPase [Rhizobium leguminosarum]OOO46056.1 ATP-dependent hydrolase [Rhizobium leguminosarum bv. viciae USDA 2370]